jgi:hypothetical protein
MFSVVRLLVMKYSVLLLAAILILSFDAAAQQAAVEAKPTPDAGQTSPQRATFTEPNTPDDLMSWWEWLEVGETPEKVERLVGLGVERKVAEAFTSQENIVAKVEPLRLEPHQTHAVLFLPCVEDDAYLYVLRWENNSWHLKDHKSFDCHYDLDVFFVIAPIRNATRDEIQVHHACEGHGTGYLEQRFRVFSVDRGKLIDELETDEVLHESRQGGGPRRDLVQSSTFTLIPIRQSKVRAIEETRSTLLNDRLTVQRRIFRWDGAKRRYLPSKFFEIEAEP